jgi:hypothetical protein
MLQRLGIARALVNDPVLVFLYEPTLGLDPAGQRQIFGIVRDIAERGGATVVLSTHTLPEVEEICTTVLILDGGRAIASGTVSEITRSVSVQRSGRLRLPIDLVGRAKKALAEVEGLALESCDRRSDVLAFSLTERPGDHAEDGMNTALRAVLRVEVPVLSFELGCPVERRVPVDDRGACRMTAVSGRPGAAVRGERRMKTPVVVAGLLPALSAPAAADIVLNKTEASAVVDQRFHATGKALTRRFTRRVRG